MLTASPARIRSHCPLGKGGQLGSARRALRVAFSFLAKHASILTVFCADFERIASSECFLDFQGVYGVPPSSESEDSELVRRRNDCRKCTNEDGISCLYRDIHGKDET